MLEKEKPKQWKSLEQWENTLEFQASVQNEFLTSPHAEGLSDEDGKQSGWARRDFLKVMGASVALSTAGCLRRPAEKIIPYVNRPKDIILGVANYYTSTFIDNGEATGVVVKTREGRPIKVEGNKEHPINNGGLTARGQAHVLSLYDPDRLRHPKKNLHNEKRTNRDETKTSWEAVNKDMIAKLASGKVAVLTSTASTLTSPSTKSLLKEFFTAFPGKHYTWDAASTDVVVAGQDASYGTKVFPRYRMDKANLIVSIGADFLGTYASPAEYTKQFSSKRNPDGNMNKLVVFESMLSLTGTNADERHRIKPSEQLSVVMNLLHEIIVVHGHSKYANDSSVKNTLNSFKPMFSSELKAGNAELAKNLWTNKGKSLVVAGGVNTQTAQAKELQIAVNLLNSVLGNDGITVDYKNVLKTVSAATGSIKNLLADINSGKVDTLIIHDTNPNYSLPKSMAFAESLNKVKTVLHLGEQSETALVSDYMMPGHHTMESWSDAEMQSGVFSIQQPTVRPLYDSKSFQGMLIDWMKAADKKLSFGDETISEEKNWHGYVRNYWANNILSKSGFNAKWDMALQQGYFSKVDDRSAVQSARSFKIAAFTGIKSIATSGKELVLYKKIGLGDGKFANLSWLQELPDPVTKIVWDNYVNVSPKTAKEMSLSEGSVVEVMVPGKERMEAPVHIQPGVHDDTFALAIGYGRTSAGKVGNGVGVNAFELTALSDSENGSGDLVFSGQLVSIKKTKKMYKLANTQGHHTMLGRPIAAEASYDEYKKNPEAGKFKQHFSGTIWDDHKYTGHKWGMVIDTNSCTGCSACVIACQAENNIPSVGKKYVLQGREMHWIRIDRYFSESPSDPETIYQPMVCQHCDNAPCETVCPVVATSHSDEGLNEMTYNRCVGTRYCANNCPYKVRRFNWFNFTKYESPQESVLNPEVMVRSRGVMEKCSFCVQKIKEAKNVAKDEDRKLKDGEVVTACEQSCPAEAITFGDINDPESKVSKLMGVKRAYTLLEELNNKNAVRYLTKVRNRTSKSQHQEGGHH